MQRLHAQLGFVAAVAILAVPSAASAAHVVPPGNSAANQYTETFPTAKGPATTKKHSKQRGRSPSETLGRRNARRLASEGPEGRELAAVVAATAPVARNSGGAPDRSGGNSVSGSGAIARADALDDSSSFGKVVAQTTGSSDSGGMGIALPLVILAAAVGFAIYLWRRRRIAA